MKNIIKHNGSKIDLSTLSKEELLILKSEIEFSMIRINNQISEAKQKAKFLQEYSNPEWLKSVNDARGFLNRNLQLVNIALSALKSKNIKENHAKDEIKKNYPFSHYFLEAAKKHLPREDYEYISKLAELYRDEDVSKGIKVLE